MSFTALASCPLRLSAEFPSFLSTAYDLCYKSQDVQGNLIQKVAVVFYRYVTLISEILFTSAQTTSYARNVERIGLDFLEIEKKIGESDKPILVYFVSCLDYDGSILGNNAYYYHLYKIKNYEKDFSVAPFVVADAKHMNNMLLEIKARFPSREIKVVDIVSHGSQDSLFIPKDEHSFTDFSHLHCIEDHDIRSESIEEDGFGLCAKDAVIILEASYTAQGKANIARQIAVRNLGKTVLAPEGEIGFSRLIVRREKGQPKVQDLVCDSGLWHGPTAKRYQFSNVSAFAVSSDANPCRSSQFATA